MKQGMTVLLPEGIDKEDLKRKAAEIGIKYTILAQEGIGIIMDWDAAFYHRVKDYADGLGITVGMLIESMLLRRFVESEVKQEVWGTGGAQILPEFTITDKGRLRGLELVDYLRSWLTQEEERKRLELLRQQEERGLLTDDDKAFLVKQRAGQTWLESKEYAKEREAEAKLTPKQKEALDYARERLGKLKEGGK